MASGVARCAECGWLKAVYEHATVLRMQAEADLVRVVFSQNQDALQAVTHTANSTLAAWIEAEKALRQHERMHIMAGKDCARTLSQAA